MREIAAGSIDQSTIVRVLDDTSFLPEEAVAHNAAGIAFWYRREGGTKQAIALADLAALDSAHADGGWEHIDDGYYRLDVPDAAFAAGAAGVMIGGTVTGMIVVGTYHPIRNVDFKKNVAVTGFRFAMFDLNGQAAAGKAITAQKISKDGGAEGNIAAVVAEIGAGWYKVDLSAAEMNADEIGLRFSADACRDTLITIYTD